MSPAFRLLTDERLARLAESGSDQALSALYGRYAGVLEGYCRSLVIDPDDARDATQNTLLKAMLAMRRGGRSAPLRPWLFRIAHNESMNILRARARRPERLDEGVRCGGVDAHRQAEARERVAELLAQMQLLTSHQRGALVMRELGGMGYDEIAGALETTPLAARQAVFAARRSLGRKVGLRLLVPPVALAFSGGSAGGAAGGAVVTKLVAGLATASIAIGGVEVAVENAPAPAPAKQRAAVDSPAPEKPRKRAPARAPQTAAPKAAVEVAATPVVAPVATVAPIRAVAYVRSQKETAAREERAARERPVERRRPERRAPVEELDRFADTRDRSAKPRDHADRGDSEAFAAADCPPEDGVENLESLETDGTARGKHPQGLTTSNSPEGPR